MTVGRWVKNYDEKGFDGLIADYSNCGSECRLTDEQLAELIEIITDSNEHYDIKRVHRLIEENTTLNILINKHGLLLGKN